MKNNNSVNFLALILIATIPLFSQTDQAMADPKTHCVVVDMDDVFVKANKGNIAWHLLGYVTDPFFWYHSLNDGRLEKMKAVLSKSENGSSFAFRLADAVRGNNSLEKQYDSFLKKFQRERRLVRHVIDVLRSLKDKGYTIIVATNRDRMSFELTAKKLKLWTLYHGKKLFDLVITGGNQDFIKATTNGEGKRFSRFAFDATHDGDVIQLPYSKPDKEYFVQVRGAVNNYVQRHPEKFAASAPTILFFDDQTANIKGAEEADVDIKGFTVPAKKKGSFIAKIFDQKLPNPAFYQKAI